MCDDEMSRLYFPRLSSNVIPREMMNLTLLSVFADIFLEISNAGI